MIKSFVIGLLLFSSSAWAGQTWQALDTTQRQALAPLAQQWHTLPDAQQQGLLRLAKRYPSLTPIEKQRFQKKLIVWNKLTPEQRRAAREKYRTLSKNPHVKREHLLKQARAKKLAPQPASAVLPPSSVIPTPKN